MKKQANSNYNSNDDVQTPENLARLIADHFPVKGDVLEPCKGDGNFYEVLDTILGIKSLRYCEIKENEDFLALPDDEHFDWIVTNPPWSKIQDFMRKSFTVADNVVFLMTVNHAMTTCRDRIMRENGFAIKEILLVDWPVSFVKSGFLLGAIYWERGYNGPTTWIDTRVKNESKSKKNSK